ncbi:MAG: hypothetical protein OCD76_25600, partial [Reichenbachiella sp.]
LGENASATFNDFWKPDDQGDFTLQLADFPGVARASAVSFMIGDQVYAGSGTDAVGNYLSDFYRYDPETDSWTQIADFGGGVRNHAVAFAIGDYGYVGTGINDTDEQSDFWTYDPDTDTWTEMVDWGASKRQQAFAFVIGGQAYVGGGYYFDSFQLQLSDIQMYDPETDSWTEKIFADGLNLSTNNAAAFSIYGNGYIAYGSKDNLIKYDPRTNEVENLGDYFEWGGSRTGASAYVHGDAAYVGLGRSGSTYPMTFDTYFEENVLPTNLSISSDGISENQPMGTLVSVLTAEDQDEFYGFIHELTAGDGTNDEGNDAFYISNDSLYSDLMFNYEIQNAYSIYLSAIDSRGGVYEKAFTINVTDVNDTPDSLWVSNLTVNERNEETVLVGLLNTRDEDLSDNTTYSFIIGDGINDADNEYFTIANSSLYIINPDFEEQSLFSVNIEVVDDGGASFEQSFEITVTDVNEAPSDILFEEDAIVD